MKKHDVFLLTLSVIVLLACSLPFLGGSPESSAVDVPEEVVEKVPAAVLTAVPSPTPDLSPVTVQVNADGSGDYATLHDAVVAVPAGSSINLGAGVYTLPETLKIEKTLSILGVDPQQTIIRGAVENGAIIDFQGPGTFAFYNITIEDTGSDTGIGLLIEDGEEIHVKNCRFNGGAIDEHTAGTGSGGIGLTVGGSTTGVIEQCEFFNQQIAGFAGKDQSNVALVSNHSHDNGVEGMGFIDQSKGEMLYNQVSNNVQFGVTVQNQASIKAHETDCWGNKASGFGLADDTTAELTSNRIEKNGEAGIHIYGNATALIEGNLISENGIHGLEMREQCRVEIKGNVIQNNKQIGVWYQNTAEGPLEENTIFGNGWGIVIEATAHAQMWGNSVSGNTEKDIWDKR